MTGLAETPRRRHWTVATALGAGLLAATHQRIHDGNSVCGVGLTVPICRNASSVPARFAK